MDPFLRMSYKFEKQTCYLSILKIRRITHVWIIAFFQHTKKNTTLLSQQVYLFVRFGQKFFQSIERHSSDGNREMRNKHTFPTPIQKHAR
jgi:hypothetical protein